MSNRSLNQTLGLLSATLILTVTAQVATADEPGGQTIGGPGHRVVTCDEPGWNGQLFASKAAHDERTLCLSLSNEGAEGCRLIPTFVPWLLQNHEGQHTIGEIVEGGTTQALCVKSGIQGGEFRVRCTSLGQTRRCPFSWRVDEGRPDDRLGPLEASGLTIGGPGSFSATCGDLGGAADWKGPVIFHSLGHKPYVCVTVRNESNCILQLWLQDPQSDDPSIPGTTEGVGARGTKTLCRRVGENRLRVGCFDAPDHADWLCRFSWRVDTMP
jgi:hypothetical protein